MKNPIILLIASFMGLLLATAHAQLSLTNMVAYYPFNGNSNDESGNGRNGTENGATLTTDRFGNLDSAYKFDGDSIVYPGLPINLAGPYTFSAWMDLHAFEPGMEIFEISNGGVCNGNPVLFQVASTVSINHCGGGQPNILFDTASNATNRWQHFVMTVTNNVTRIYRNSLLVSSKTNAPWPATTNVTLTLAAARNGIGQFAKCAFDDVRLYDRALSSFDVAHLHAIESHMLLLNVRKAVYVDMAGLVIGTNYQAQVSTNLTTWTDFGSAFTATNSFWRPTNYWDVDNWNQLFFRILPLP